MDYKLNVIGKQIKCEEPLLQDIPALKFTDIDDVLVFDATEYCLVGELEDFDYRAFSRMNKRYIEYIAGATGIDMKKMFFQEKGGHILVVQDLVFMFLAYVEQSLCSYFNNILADAMANGIAFTDGFAVQLAMQRIPSDVMREIINNRDDKGKETG